LEENTRSARGYRTRAEQLRAEADTVKDDRTKKALIEIAANYDQLADRVEKIANSN